eukprot:COSAG02_NODE_36525_length_453_cov_1.166667_2_plen_48_part_01
MVGDPHTQLKLCGGPEAKEDPTVYTIRCIYCNEPSKVKLVKFEPDIIQ